MKRSSIMRLALVATVLLGCLVGVLRRGRGRSEDRQVTMKPVPGVEVHLTTPQGDVESEDRGGDWANDGGAAPGRPGDSSEQLSSVPTTGVEDGSTDKSRLDRR